MNDSLQNLNSNFVVFSVFICALDPCPGHVNKTWLFLYMHACVTHRWDRACCPNSQVSIPQAGETYSSRELERQTLWPGGRKWWMGNIQHFQLWEGKCSQANLTLYPGLMTWAGCPRGTAQESLCVNTDLPALAGLLWRAGALTIWGILNWRDGMLFIKQFHELVAQTSLL